MSAGRRKNTLSGTRAPGNTREPIAIIGIGCRFPGDVDGPASFWRLLCDGKDAITEVPADRWSIRAFYDPDPGTPGKTYAKWGGFLKGIDAFDAGFFGISPREAAVMDPQQRLLLEVAYEAIEDAGQPLESLSGSDTAVYVGVSTTDYQQLQSAHDDQDTGEVHSTTGTVMSIVANRISYCFNLQGPSVAVDTACSSSLVAVHLACRSLWEKESALAIAGGVNIILSPQQYIGYCKLSMLSRDGRCKAFDASGNGFVRGEGIGAVLLKPLSRALQDGDRIYALVKGTAVNQDGRTNGITVPSRESQAAMVRQACAAAGVAPAQVQYVEAHGTGTSVGDPIEAEALGSVLSRRRPSGTPCLIGSVKTNIGHLEAGAGIAGLIKTALCIWHRQIPPSLHFTTPNPLIDFTRLKLAVPTTLGPWPDDSAPLLAGVNSFGFGGTNAHALLGEAPQREAVPPHAPSAGACAARLFPFSAQSDEALQGLARRSVELCKGMAQGDEDALLDALGSNLALRTSHHSHRLGIVARTKEELLLHLEAFCSGEARTGMHSGVASLRSGPGVVFVFSGQGQQWWAMGRQLLDQEPVFRRAVEECDAVLARFAPWSLRQELMQDEATSRLQETSIAQPVIFALQAGLAALWKSWGIEPAAVIGHSVGEVAAAYVAGALSLEDAVRVIYHRGRTMDRVTSLGRMLGVGMNPRDAAELIRGIEDRVSIAAINSPSSVTLSGDPEVLEALAKTLEERQVFRSFLKVNYAFHSPQMEPVREELLGSLQGISPASTRVSFFSTVLGGFIKGAELDAHYWWQNVRQTVQFGPGIEELVAAGRTLFVELSAHPVLSVYVHECLKARGTHGTVVPSLRRNEEDMRVILSALGGLYSAGYPVDWTRQYSSPVRHMTLARYPWSHESFWHECETMRTWRLGTSPHPLLGERLKTAHPTWRLELSRAALPYLLHHRVQGYAVFPAAGYLELALAAAREVLPGPVLSIEDIDFLKALFIPEAGTAPTLQTTVNPEDSFFTVHSRTGPGQPWTLHARGKLRSEQAHALRDPVDLEHLRTQYSERISGELCYQTFSDRGLQFGPSFRGIEYMLRRDGESLASVRLPASLESDVQDYNIHPAALDACLQALSGALPHQANVSDAAVVLPVHVGQVKFYTRPPGRIWSHARLLQAGRKSLEGNITLLDHEGHTLLEVRGLQGQSVDAVQGTSPEATDDWMYEVLWQLKPRTRSTRPDQQADYMPAMADLEQRLHAESLRLADLAGWREKSFAAIPAITRLCSSYLLQAFRELGWTPVPGEKVSPEPLAARLGILSRYHRLLARYFAILADDGILRRQEDGWDVAAVPDTIDPAGTWRSLLQEFPGFCPELMLTAACGSRLAEVLQGKVNPLALIFPEGSQTAAEHLYQDSSSFKVENMLAASAVAMALEHLPEGRKVRLLEIGGGTAGMTSYVLPGLPADGVEYVFTDISPHFLGTAEQKLRDAPFVKFQTLDIEKDPEVQGFLPHSFDVILASDVLHATRDLRSVLGNVQRLLASDGLFVFLEIDRPAPWTDLVFGLTEGWWRFTDHELRPSYPVLSRTEWARLLRETGFRDPISISHKDRENEASQMVFVSRGPEVGTQPAPRAPEAPGAQLQHWLIFADNGGTGAAIAETLRLHGAACTIVTHGPGSLLAGDDSIQVDPARPEDFRQLLPLVARTHPSLHGVIHCWSLDASPPEETSLASLEEAAVLGCHSVMHLIQAWSATGAWPRFDLWLVTGGVQPAGAEGAGLSVAQAPLVGLGRVIANEHPDLHCRVVDLSRSPSPAEIESLHEELLGTDTEDEIALRERARYVLGLARSSALRSLRHGKLLVNPSMVPVRVESDGPSVLDNLVLRESVRRRPGRGEVEIRVIAASLNFRDVLKALGVYPAYAGEGLTLGDECAGVITALGEDVQQFAVGDEVVAGGRGTLSSFVTTSSATVLRKPPHLSFEEAATIPVAFITASFALQHLGRIAPGERVLVHAGAGGVGLAAIQVARLAGAEVFATAGSQEKRDLLRSLGVRHVMSSRSLAFADEIMEITGGQGVDVVLNSLAGDAIERGLSCLAPAGRFIELGIRDIFQNTRLGLRAFRNGVSLISVSPASLAGKDLFGSSLQATMRLFESRQLHPLPHRVFPLGEVRNAFRYMAQARHIGKVVISFTDTPVAVEPRAATAAPIRDDATYLITGGLGGFGLATAEWLVASGARHLVLAGRTAQISGDAGAVIAAMEGRGAQVVVSRADVTRQEDVARVLAVIQASMPPLRGVIHSAMILDDGLLLQLTADRFSSVMHPKILGAWNLHCATQHLPLDFFLLYSSVATLAGNPGQGNYVAANLFLDTLAHYRRRQGLPALSVAWGHVSDVGYVSRNAQVGAHLDSIGLKGFRAKAALQAMGRMLGSARAQVGIMKVDWQQWFQHGASHTSSRFSLLADPALAQADPGKGRGHIREILLAAQPGDRLDLLRTFVTEQVARVLGMSPARLDPERPISEMGLDSLMMMELKNRLEKEAGVSLPTTELMRGPNILTLTRVLLDQIPGLNDSAERTASPAGPPNAPAGPQATTLAGPQTKSAAELLAGVATLPEAAVDALLQDPGYEKELKAILEEKERK